MYDNRQKVISNMIWKQFCGERAKLDLARISVNCEATENKAQSLI